MATNRMTRIFSMFSGFVLAAGSAGAAAQVPDTTTPIAFVGAAIFDATGDALITDGVIVIEGKRIRAVGRRDRVTVPANARRIDVSGKYITPGLIDTNAHLVLSNWPEFYVKYEDRLEEVALQSAQVALKYGVTTVRDTWGPLPALLKVRDRINRGEAIGSRTFVAGNIIGLGGPFSAHFLGARGEQVSPLIRRRIDAIWEAGVGPELIRMTPEQIHRAMGRYLDQGVDFVKFAASAHGLSPEPLMFSTEQARAMADAVHERGLVFETHAIGLAAMKVAIDAGVDLIQHPQGLGLLLENDDPSVRAAASELLAQIRKKKIIASVMPGMTQEQIRLANERQKDPAYEGLVSSPAIRFSQGVRKFVQQGIFMSMATDAGPQDADIRPRPTAPLIGREHFIALESLVEAGMTPAQALVTATRNGAIASRRLQDLGTIEAGKLADLVVVSRNPLEDVRAMRDIEMVVKEGSVVDRERLPENRVLKFDPEAPWPFVTKPSSEAR